MIRISDIAKAMNLSEATISNALTGKGRMKPETREAIRTYAAQMGYQTRPRHTPRSQGTPVLIIESCRSTFITAMLNGILREATPNGLQLPVHSLEITDSSKLRNPSIPDINHRIQEFLTSLDHEVPGIIYLSQYARRVDGLLSGLSIPVVSAFCTREDGGAFIHYDDHQGAYLAVNTLLEGGCRRIAMISGPIDSIGMYLRSSGYQQALVEHGLPYDPRLVRIGDWDQTSGYQQTAKLLEEETQIDGIFAQNDEIGIGAIQAVRERGLSIPGDVSIIGFDNNPLCRLSTPQLSSIQPPFEEMGRQAYALLLELMSRKETIRPAQQAPACPLLPCTLVRRESMKSIS